MPPRWLFVKICDEDGNVGWGEASLEGHTQAVEGCLDAWFDRYKSYEADDIEHIWQMSWRTTFYRGGPVFMSALAGIDIALWDLKGAGIIRFSFIRKKKRPNHPIIQRGNWEFQYINYSEASCVTSLGSMRGLGAIGREMWKSRRK